MNFLQLCQRTLQETGIADSGLTQVTGQTGDNKRIVDWVNESWIRIQSARTDWGFMWNEASSVTTVGTSLWPIPETVEQIVDIELDGRVLARLKYADYRDTYRSLTDGRPTGYSVLPSGANVAFNATPDAAYPLSYQYYARPTYMTANTDVPSIPERFHMLIVWRALSEYAMFDEAPELAQKASLYYTQIFAELVNDQTPDMELPGAIA